MEGESFKEFDFIVSPLEPARDLLIAELGAVGFESFMETETGVLAYINSKEWFEEILEGVSILDHPLFSFNYSIKTIEQQNWNAEWEKNFNPITIEGQCQVRAPFHPKLDIPYDIEILPKMSFGTGHHQTTYMMLSYILENDFKQKSVLDMGSGTAVLAILAAYKGAVKIQAIDIDAWCYENAIENVERNNCNYIEVIQGDASAIEDQYDVILANINRNILLTDIPTYVTHLNKGGSIYFSGFYLEDLDLIKAKCLENKLTFDSYKQKDQWISAKFVL
jgi:ribosomal protein L11 methyltransferase